MKTILITLAGVLSYFGALVLIAPLMDGAWQSLFIALFVMFSVEGVLLYLTEEKK
ncbi:MAG: hypothetical protein J6S14_10935 [Clostridia bacterium]|nr:hypothetical protein [Clostridia bacterium]